VWGEGGGVWQADFLRALLLPESTTFSNSQREAYLQAKIEEYTDDEEVVRLDGGMICPICNLPYRSHDRSKKYNLPGFIQMCNGRTGKF
jgi:hypothetical protein